MVLSSAGRPALNLKFHNNGEVSLYPPATLHAPMVTFQGPKVAWTPGDNTPTDSFARALSELDRIPLSCNPNQQDRLSNYPELDADNDDFLSHISERHRTIHSATWTGGDSTSTLKGVNEVESNREMPS